MRYNMNKDLCKGCVFNATDKSIINEEAFNVILDNCSVCKRAMKKEFQNRFKDLYTTKK